MIGLCLKTFPEKVNSDCANQIDHALNALGVDMLLGVVLMPKEHDLKISSQLIFEHLGQIDSVTTQWVEWESLKGDFTKNPHLCFSINGMNHLIEKADNNKFLLKRYMKIGEVIESVWVTRDDMLDSGILPQALRITKKQPASALGQPLLPPPSKDAEDDESVAKEHYVTRHFRLQARTALSIIGISVVIAPLGVITPLGFQTFTDKILPYQAQSSLMVIAILLVVAAMMTALFNYYRDYQESVLFAKYQSGLGKEVFSRLLAMEVPYFDLVT